MDQPTAWERFFPDKPPGTATTVSHPVEEDGGDFFDLNAWVDFALTNPSEIPLLAASQPEKPSGKVLALLTFGNTENNRQR